MSKMMNNKTGKLSLGNAKVYLTVLTLLTLGTAQAEEETAKKQSQPATVAPAAAPGLAPAGAVANQMTGTSVSAPGQSTISVDEAKPAEKRKVLGEFYTSWSMSKPTLNNRSGVPSSSNYLGVKYKVTDKSSLSLRQLFTFTPKNGETAFKSRFEDTYINYAQSKLATFGTDGFVNISALRLYMPTGDTSRLVSGRTSRVLGWFSTGYTVGKMDFVWHLIPDYHLQSKDFTIGADGKEVRNLEFGMDNLLEAYYNVVPGFGLAYSAGVTNSWSRPNSVGATEFGNNFSQYVSADYSFGKAVVALYVYNDINIASPTQGFKLWRDDEMRYVFLVSASI